MTSFEDRYNNKHRRISLAKSMIRLFGCIILGITILVNWTVPNVVDFNTQMVANFAFVFSFFAAEILGIFEEMI